MSIEIGSWSGSCLQCQQSKISSNVKSSVPQIPVPGWWFLYAHVDIVGPLPSSHGYSYLLTMIGRSTRWPEVVSLSSITAESYVHAFISTWVSRCSVPATLTSDRGSQFISSIWTGVCRELGITVSKMTSYHPQANGMIERFHRRMKVSLRTWAVCSNWFHNLPLVLLGLWTVSKEGTGFCSAEAVYSSALSVLGEFLSVPEFPQDSFLRKIQLATSGFFNIPPPHHAAPTDPKLLPRSLLQADICPRRFLCSYPFSIPFLPCTKVPIKFWNVEINSPGSRLVRKLMLCLLTGSNQLYQTPRLSLPGLRLVVVLFSALRIRNQTHLPQLRLELSEEFGSRPSPQLLFAGTHTDQQETNQETSPLPSISLPWFLGWVLWRTSRPTFHLSLQLSSLKIAADIDSCDIKPCYFYTSGLLLYLVNFQTLISY